MPVVWRKGCLNTPFSVRQAWIAASKQIRWRQRLPCTAIAFQDQTRPESTLSAPALRCRISNSSCGSMRGAVCSSTPIDRLDSRTESIRHLRNKAVRASHRPPYVPVSRPGPGIVCEQEPCRSAVSPSPTFSLRRSRHRRGSHRRGRSAMPVRSGTGLPLRLPQGRRSGPSGCRRRWTCAAGPCRRPRRCASRSR